VTRKFGGTGLGTTICKQLVEMMGGRIGLESEEEEGSTFWFSACFTKQKKPQLPFCSHGVDPRDLKVLVVDDFQKQRSTLMEYLRDWGAIPSEARGAREALKMIEDAAGLDRPYHLVITDFNMLDMNGFHFAKAIRMNSGLRTTRIILLTALGKLGDGRTCKEIGIEGYLTKPFNDKELRDVVELVMGLSKAEEATTPSELITRHTIAEREQKTVHILLVEDYPTNQQVVQSHLRRHGYRVDLADDGQKAVDAFKNKQYDLILMDIQMPVMDGRQATRIIRSIESERAGLAGYDNARGIQRVPIIATTAHAMKGVDEECLKAGMNDYLSKPFSREDLLATVDKWLKVKGQAISCVQQGPSVTSGSDSSNLESLREESEPPMDLKKAIDEFEGDKELLSEVLKGFLDNVRSQIPILLEALESGNAEVVRREAHSLKGGSSNLTAYKLARIAHELETNAKSCALDAGRETLNRLAAEYDRLGEYARQLLPDSDFP